MHVGGYRDQGPGDGDLCRTPRCGRNVRGRRHPGASLEPGAVQLPERTRRVKRCHGSQHACAAATRASPWHCLSRRSADSGTSTRRARKGQLPRRGAVVRPQAEAAHAQRRRRTRRCAIGRADSSGVFGVARWRPLVVRTSLRRGRIRPLGRWQPGTAVSSGADRAWCPYLGRSTCRGSTSSSPTATPAKVSHWALEHERIVPPRRSGPVHGSHRTLAGFGW